MAKGQQMRLRGRRVDVANPQPLLPYHIDLACVHRDAQHLRERLGLPILPEADVAMIEVDLEAVGEVFIQPGADVAAIRGDVGHGGGELAGAW